MEIIRANARGAFQNDWLKSRHSFSFGDYYDPSRMGFSTLRVINEDWVAAGGGFSMHGHRDMEIITYVLDGALSHKDSLGNGDTIRPGDVQRMSAGRGILHSEFNHSADTPVHLLQIWIQPTVSGIQPSYAQQHFPLEGRRGRLQLVASPDGRDGSLSLNTDTNLYASVLQGGDSVSFTTSAGRALYVQVARGQLKVNGETLEAGDALQSRMEGTWTFSTPNTAEFLLFDLP